MKTLILNPLPIGIEGTTMKDAFIRVGGNPGNMLFLESMKDELEYSDIITLNTPTEKIPKDASIVVPSSNFLCSGGNLSFYEKYIDFFNKIDNEITFCGLGAQSTKTLNTPQKLVDSLNPIQKKFFNKMSEKATSIGVRGEFTAECLSLLGVHNIRIIGCPSFYKYLDGKYPTISQPSLGGGVQMTFTPGGFEQSRVLSLGMKYNCSWVIQEMSEYPRMMDILGHKMISTKWILKNAPSAFFKGRELQEYNEKMSHVFWNINAWNEFYKKENIKFAFGTRFHGNMEALRNGVPALWITHDSRTAELTAFLHLPNITMKRLSTVKRLDELLQYCDYTDLKKNYYGLCKNYVDYLTENKLNHRYKLVDEANE